jgi:NitT/TauT family transport system substrate-binding protein
MRMMFGALLGALVLLSASAQAAIGAPHQAPRGPRVVLAVDGLAETRNLPIVLAERLGYFRDEGLTVTLVDAPADPSPAQLLADGRADGAVAFYHHTFMSQADDHRVTEAVVVMGATPALKLVVASRLKATVRTLADLKGLRIYTGGANSGKTTTANWLMRRAGLALTDYTPLQPVGHEQMARALASGEADAIVSHEPDASDFVASGEAFVLADVSSVAGTRASLGSVFPSTALYLPRDYVEAHSSEVQRLVNACLRALAYTNGRSADEIVAALPARAGGKDRAAFVALVAKDKQMFATDGRMDPEAADEEWRVMSALTPKYASVRLGETFTNRFVDAAAGQPSR